MTQDTATPRTETYEQTPEEAAAAALFPRSASRNAANAREAASRTQARRFSSRRAADTALVDFKVRGIR
jgi:hypothetical protein